MNGLHTARRSTRVRAVLDDSALHVGEIVANRRNNVCKLRLFWFLAIVGLSQLEQSSWAVLTTVGATLQLGRNSANVIHAMNHFSRQDHSFQTHW